MNRQSQGSSRGLIRLDAQACVLIFKQFGDAAGDLRTTTEHGRTAPNAAQNKTTGVRASAPLSFLICATVEATVLRTHERIHDDHETTVSHKLGGAPLLVKSFLIPQLWGPSSYVMKCVMATSFSFMHHMATPAGTRSPRHAWGVLPPSVDSLSHGVHISRREKVCRDDPTFLQKFGVVRPDATRG
jgi:hypothetical protein